MSGPFNIGDQVLVYHMSGQVIDAGVVVADHGETEGEWWCYGVDGQRAAYTSISELLLEPVAPVFRSAA